MVATFQGSDYGVAERSRANGLGVARVGAGLGEGAGVVVKLLRTGSTGEPTERFTSPSGWAPALRFAGSRRFQGKSGRVLLNVIRAIMALGYHLDDSGR